MAVSSETQLGNACSSPALSCSPGAEAAPLFPFAFCWLIRLSCGQYSRSTWGKLSERPLRLKGQGAGGRTGGDAEVIGVSGKKSPEKLVF